VLTNVTDGQTDRQTDRRTSSDGMTATLLKHVAVKIQHHVVGTTQSSVLGSMYTNLYNADISSDYVPGIVK